MRAIPVVRVLSVLFAAFVMLGSMSVSSLAAPGGNSVNAQLCQKGNWANLAPLENESVPFVNQGDCVSYGAQGGTIVDLVVADVSIVYVQIDASGGIVTLGGTGLLPGSDLTLDVFYLDGTSAEGIPVGSADANGDFSLDLAFSCELFSSITLYGVAPGGAVVSESGASPC